MYNAVSEFIGLTFLEAGKTMGLAAYGRARAIEPWPIYNLTSDSFKPPFKLPANATHRDIMYGWWDHFRTLGYRKPQCTSQDLDKDEHAVRLAWSAQVSLQQVCALLADRARRSTGHGTLCLSGGVALNCSSNGLLPQPVFVPPVPHDAGVSLGAAWSVAPPRSTGKPLSPYLGRSLSVAEIDAALTRNELTGRSLSTDELAERLLAGHVGAIVTGRAEVGPRALCHRSIIASPIDQNMRDRLNLAKGRELWRPLGPVGLPECEGRYWTGNETLHRYMVGASQVTERGQTEVPAIVHVDRTARPQVISDHGEAMWSLLDALRKAGAPSVTINTSFNLRGEPIVDDAEGAIRSARAIGLDFLILEDRLVDLTRRRGLQSVKR
jgi:carbamoyltransferase